MYSHRSSLVFLLTVFLSTFIQANGQQTIDNGFMRDKDGFTIDLTDAIATFRDLPQRPEPLSISVHSYTISFQSGMLSILHDAYDQSRCANEKKPVDPLRNIKAQFANNRKDYVLLSERNEEESGFTIGQLTYQTSKKETIVYKQYLNCSHLYLLSGHTRAESSEISDPVIRAINSFGLKGDK